VIAPIVANHFIDPSRHFDKLCGREAGSGDVSFPKSGGTLDRTNSSPTFASRAGAGDGMSTGFLSHSRGSKGPRRGRSSDRRTRWPVEALERRTLLSFEPIGPEFGVNTFTPNFQDVASVAADADGDFVVAWVSQSVLR